MYSVMVIHSYNYQIDENKFLSVRNRKKHTILLVWRPSISVICFTAAKCHPSIKLDMELNAIHCHPRKKNHLMKEMTY